MDTIYLAKSEASSVPLSPRRRYFNNWREGEHDQLSSFPSPGAHRSSREHCKTTSSHIIACCPTGKAFRSQWSMRSSVVFSAFGNETSLKERFIGGSAKRKI